MWKSYLFTMFRLIFDEQYLMSHMIDSLINMFVTVYSSFSPKLSTWLYFLTSLMKGYKALTDAQKFTVTRSIEGKHHHQNN